MRAWCIVRRLDGFSQDKRKILSQAFWPCSSTRSCRDGMMSSRESIGPRTPRGSAEHASLRRHADKPNVLQHISSICTPKTTSDIHKRHAAVNIQTSPPASRRRSRKIRIHHRQWMLEANAGRQPNVVSGTSTFALHNLRCCHHRLEHAWMGFLDVVSFL